LIESSLMRSNIQSLMGSNLQMRNVRGRLRHLFLIVACVASCSSYVVVRAQQSSASEKMRLAKIEIVGLKRMKEEEIVAASGLQVGQTLSVDDFDAASQRLLASGLVTKVGYKLRERGGEATLTFEVTESERGANLPVVFDNFVWFTPDEIASAVRREVPAFDGTAADSSAVIAGVKRALEGLLRERKIAATVEYMPSSNLDMGGERKHVFTARGVSLPLCAAHFPGASGVAEKELVEAARQQQLISSNYSSELVSNFAAAALKEIYHERGFLRVEFAAPSATLGGECGASGVAVTVPVREGLAYNWGGARWTGNESLSAAELDAALGMRAGELANGAKINKSLMAVARAYGRKGYLAVALKPSQDFDDAARIVAYRFDVREGAQYHMGALNVEGLADADAERIKSKWAIKEGEVYDAAYVETFVRQAISDVTRATGKPVRVSVERLPDAQKQTVDVTLAFKSG
jgi:outer membrane protein insertion porin family